MKPFIGQAAALALPQEYAPIVARDRPDRFWNGNEPVLLLIDMAVGFQPFVAGAHAMQGDQDHRQVIGETKRKFRAPLSRPGDGPLETVLRRGVPMRSDGARRRRSHEHLQCASRVAIASAEAWKATFGQSMSIGAIKKRARVSSFSTNITAQCD